MPHVFMIQTYLPEDILSNILKNYLHDFLARVFHCGIVSVLKKFWIFLSVLDSWRLSLWGHCDPWGGLAWEVQISFCVLSALLCCSRDLSISCLPSKRLYCSGYHHYCLLCPRDSSLDFWILHSSHPTVFDIRTDFRMFCLRKLLALSVLWSV